jgi:hypothetical protein
VIDYKFNNYVDETYVKYTDSTGRIEFLILENSSYGFGNIIINGKSYKAIFYFSSIRASGIDITKFNEDPLKGVENSQFIYVTLENNAIKASDNKVDIFGEEFENFILTRTKVDRSLIDASQYYGIEWSEINDTLHLKFDSYSSLNGEGTAKIKTGEVVNIVFVWRDNKKFDIYLDGEANIKHNPRVSGSYISNELNLELTIEYNGGFFDDSIKTLLMKGSK